MNFFALSALVNTFTSLILGVLVLFRGRGHTYRTFALFAFSVALWSIFYFQWQESTTATQALYWTHWLMAAAAFIPFFYFHFITAFLNIESQQRFPIIAGYGFALFFSAASFTSFFIEGTYKILSFSFWPIPGLLYSPFLVVWFLYVILGTSLLFKRYRHSKDSERAQIGIILIGMIVGYLGGATNYFLWYGIPISPFGDIFVSFYVVMVAYAIVQHHLFSMKVIAAELLVFALWLFVFIRMVTASGHGQVLDAVLLVVLLVVGVLLIRSVDKEVTQREHIERQAQEVEAINKRQENLIHFIGHEVKGFLTKDSAAFASLSEGDFGDLPNEANDLIKRALTETRAGSRSVMSILRAADLKKGTLAYTMKQFDFLALLQEVFKRFTQTATEKEIALMFSVDERFSPYTMVGDKGMIGEYLLRNLIENAINYTPRGKITISLNRSVDEKLILTIVDTGIGITDEDKKFLFTEGGHGKDSIKMNAYSTGYGLYIAKGIVEGHSGTIEIKSKGAGQGTTVVVTLPTELPLKEGAVVQR